MKHGLRRASWLVGWMVAGFLPVAMAENLNASFITAQPLQVSVFKNGIGVVVAKVDLPAASGTYRIHPLPDATLGGFWLSWSEGIELSAVKATQAQTLTNVPAASLDEVVEANIGNTVWLKWKDTWWRAKILDVPRRHDDPILTPQERDTIPRPSPASRGDIVILDLGNPDVQVIPLGWIESIRFEANAAYTLSRPLRENVIELTATPTGGATPPASPQVTLTYLAKGIAWSPSYVVDISRDKRAAITAKSVILNDLLLLRDVPVELIAGFPHIQYSEVKSAFSLEPMQQIIERIRQQVSERRNEDAMISNQVVAAKYYAGAAVVSAPAEPVAGEQTEDLYFYQLPSVNLLKGERGYFPLFSADVPYEHAYSWDIPDFLDQNDVYRDDIAQVQPAIWHTLKLTNTHNQPWTSAPAMVVKDGRILGQDTLPFTAPQATTDLRITQVVSVQAEQNEFEVERQRNAAVFNQRSYDLVTVKGELVLTNRKEESMKIEITKLVRGEIRSASANPATVRLAKGLRTVNPASQLKWNVEILPGNEHTLHLDYTYQVYIRT